MWPTGTLNGIASLPLPRPNLSPSFAPKIRRTGPALGWSHLCKCSSAQPSPPPVTSDPSNDGIDEDIATATSETTAATGRGVLEQDNAVAGESVSTAVAGGDAVDEENASESVTGSQSQRARTTSKGPAANPEDNILSVGFGDKVVLLDKSKVMAMGKKTLIVFLGVTISIAVVRSILKFMSPKATRVRTVEKNREVVEELMKYLPNNRAGLSAQVLWILRLKTGFTSVEVFRKYLWFTLREKEFGQEAVDDLIYLKTALGMQDSEVAEALKERAERIYDKYGTLMLNTVGMSSSGIERKATCKALFSKMQYLTDYEPLVGTEREAYEVNLREIFGATEADVERLRIASIQEFDWDKLEKMATDDKDKPTVTNE